jgi:hypothetical protein
MPRYFEAFFVDEPMTELLEVETRALPSFVVEANAGAIQRMEVWLHGVLERVIYPDTEPGPEIAELQRERRYNKEGEQVEVVEIAPDGRRLIVKL